MRVDPGVEEISSFANRARASFEADLKALVDIPSVSMDPSHTQDISRAAHLAQQLLRKIGASSEIIQTRGNPVVYGHLLADPRYPTVAVYNHLDVQPADGADWHSSPFSMSIDDGIYRGRGTTDDKGPALTAMYAAWRAHQTKVPINIKFIWELEEEIGSPSFEEFLKANRQKLKTDSVVVSDTIWISRDRPAIPAGLRGLQGILMRLKTGSKDVHSGLTGGLARNPIGEICQLLSQCYDATTGHVSVPGFYDGVRAVEDVELADFVKSGFSVSGFMKDHDLYSVRTTDTSDAAKRIWAYPTFEVHGITGGYTGPGLKTIVPHEAEAKVTMRLVPDQDPERVTRLITDFVKARCPDIEVVPEGTLRPYLSDLKGPYCRAAAEAMRIAFGKEPSFVREGGSIGAVISMSTGLGVPITFLGLSLPEHGYHAVNENFDWHQASGGMKMFTSYFSLLSQITTS